MNAPERIRGYLDALGIAQNDLVVELEVNPATITRRIDEGNPYETFRLGVIAGGILHKRNTKRAAQQPQRT